MHFWVSAARVSLPGTAPAHLLTSGRFWPRKMGTNWFMPAFVNNRFGESGMRLDEGTMVCSFDLKKSRNDWRISLLVINFILAGPERPLICNYYNATHRRPKMLVSSPKATEGENRQIASANA